MNEQRSGNEHSLLRKYKLSRLKYVLIGQQNAIILFDSINQSIPNTFTKYLPFVGKCRLILIYTIVTTIN